MMSDQSMSWSDTMSDHLLKLILIAGHCIHEHMCWHMVCVMCVQMCVCLYLYLY